MVIWSKVCKPKDMGELGTQNFALMNKALLCKWWWEIYNTEGLWQDVLAGKYIENTCIIGIKHKVGTHNFGLSS